jgi:hypothetical protein
MNVVEKKRIQGCQLQIAIGQCKKIGSDKTKTALIAKRWLKGERIWDERRNNLGSS